MTYLEALASGKPFRHEAWDNAVLLRVERGVIQWKTRHCEWSSVPWSLLAPGQLLSVQNQLSDGWEVV